VGLELIIIPIGIIIFVLFAQKGIMHAQAAQAAQASQAQQQAIQQVQTQAAHAAQAPSQAKKDPYQELERLGSLKQQGQITEDEFQKLKMRLLSGV
jgi:uncharacterized protein YpmB